eukprot:6179174-Pleurochrysis_carterae.AAC.2
MGTTWTSAHSCPSLAADGFIHRMDAHVRSRVGSNSLSAGCPTSPARRSRLCASNAAAHCMRRSAVSRQSTRSTSLRKWCARHARTSFRVPAGGSSARMRLSASANEPPGFSGAMSHCASRERSSLTAPT